MPLADPGESAIAIVQKPYEPEAMTSLSQGDRALP